MQHNPLSKLAMWRCTTMFHTMNANQRVHLHSSTRPYFSSRHIYAPLARDCCVCLLKTATACLCAPAQQMAWYVLLPKLP